MSFTSPKTEYGMQVNFSGTINLSGFVVWLEASLDGENFFPAGNVMGQTSGVAIVMNASKYLAMYIRARTQGLSGGGSVTAFVAVKDD